MTITFSKLRDSGDWGVRGQKEPGDRPPEAGESVTVTKKDGTTQDVVIGRVVAVGDDWWLGTIAGSEDSKPDHHRIGESERQISALIAEVRELRTALDIMRRELNEMSGAVTPDVDRNADADERRAIQAEQDEADPWA